MTDWLLALVPTYGLWLIAGTTFASCLALPIPASVIMLAAGGFAAAGDLVLWQVVVSALSGVTDALKAMVSNTATVLRRDFSAEASPMFGKFYGAAQHIKGAQQAAQRRRIRKTRRCRHRAP